jgi:Ax21 family sulfation-dependent quorum factor
MTPMKRSPGFSKLTALTLLAALPALALSATASAADGVSYNYVEGGFAATNTDAGDADGFGINGSVAVHPNFHLFAGYSNQDLENTDIDFDQSRIGVGYNHQIAPAIDLVTRVAYEKFDAGSGLTFDGYSAEVGVRGALAPSFEGYAFAGHEDFEQADSEFYGRVGAQVKFNQNWGITGDVKFIDGDTQYLVGPRFTW